ncbi:MAG: hypothetical protein ACTSVO_05460 [Candidatus Heimdallarchaeaceae archaeon]
MVKIHYYRDGKLVVEEEIEEEYSEYKLDIIYVESFKTFFATIEELTTEPRWIPKNVVSKELKIKKWYTKALKEGKLEERGKEKKKEQAKLTDYLHIIKTDRK